MNRTFNRWRFNLRPAARTAVTFPLPAGPWRRTVQLDRESLQRNTEVVTLNSLNPYKDQPQQRSYLCSR